MNTKSTPSPHVMLRIGLSLALLMTYVVFEFIVKKDNSNELDIALVEKNTPVYQAELPEHAIRPVSYSVGEEEAILNIKR